MDAVTLRPKADRIGTTCRSIGKLTADVLAHELGHIINAVLDVHEAGKMRVSHYSLRKDVSKE